MSYGNIEPVGHLLDEVAFTLKHIKGIKKEQVIEGEVLSRAVVRSIEIIGEARNKTDLDFRAAHPQIE